jgi:hypothetical protein
VLRFVVVLGLQVVVCFNHLFYYYPGGLAAPAVIAGLGIVGTAVGVGTTLALSAGAFTGELNPKPYTISPKPETLHHKS